MRLFEAFKGIIFLMTNRPIALKCIPSLINLWKTADPPSQLFLLGLGSHLRTGPFF